MPFSSEGASRDYHGNVSQDMNMILYPVNSVEITVFVFNNTGYIGKKLIRIFLFYCRNNIFGPRYNVVKMLTIT